MCLSDTAEYWWDVKGYNNKPKHIFSHIPGYDCGHFHVEEVFLPEEVDCKSCMKFMEENRDKVWGMMQIAEHKHLERTKRIAQGAERKMKKKLRKTAKHGICSCGYPFVLRTNNRTGSKFLGCMNYPVCTNTKTIDK